MLRCGTVVSDARLSEILWGDDPPHGVNALHRQISTLRRLLGGSDAVERRGGGYVLSVDRVTTDVMRFESFVAAGREAMRDNDVAGASALFGEALNLWRGDTLVDVVDEPSAESERTRLTEMRLATVEARIDADLALGRQSALVAELEQLVLEHPLREHLRGAVDAGSVAVGAAGGSTAFVPVGPCVLARRARAGPLA